MIGICPSLRKITGISVLCLMSNSDQEIHQDDWHQKQEDEENDANIDVEWL